MQEWTSENGALGRPAFWAGGGPQRALEEMQKWCEDRDIGLLVTIWPFLQGLGPGERVAQVLTWLNEPPETRLALRKWTMLPLWHL